MKTINILLDNISKIQAFNKASMKFPGEHLDMISGRFRIDAKSLMGIFSLDVTKPTTLEFEDNYEDDEPEHIVEKGKPTVYNEETPPEHVISGLIFEMVYGDADTGFPMCFPIIFC